MTSPQQRRDPQPLARSGEVTLVALTGVLLLLALAALAGLGATAALVGGGWVWPRGADTSGAVLAGLLTGHPGRGLPPALAGLGAAAALAGGGWVWPGGADTCGAVLGGLLTGHPGRGLPPGLAGRVPGPAAVCSGVAIAELLILTVAGGGAALMWRYHRPGDARRGMASRGEAAQVLGRSRLRTARAIIRPDLHTPAGRGNRR